MSSFNERELTEIEKARRDEIFQKEKERLKDIEKNKEFLLDKSIGGPNALRPSDQFIMENVGKPLSERDIIDKAGEVSDKIFEKEMAQKKLAEQNRAREELAQAHKRRFEEIKREKELESKSQQRENKREDRERG